MSRQGHGYDVDLVGGRGNMLSEGGCVSLMIIISQPVLKREFKIMYSCRLCVAFLQVVL